MTALSSALANLALDLNNDGSFEIQARVQWTALKGPAGADIGDSDGDGMHNGWETAFNVSDPSADPDGDGISNLAEYQGGRIQTSPMRHRRPPNLTRSQAGQRPDP